MLTSEQQSKRVACRGRHQRKKRKKGKQEEVFREREEDTKGREGRTKDLGRLLEKSWLVRRKREIERKKRKKTGGAFWVA